MKIGQILNGVAFAGVLATGLLLQAPAQAGGRGTVCSDHTYYDPRGCFDPYRRMYYGCYVSVTRCRSACAPAAEKGNLEATQGVLKELSASAQFADASQFKAEVSRIAAIEDASARFGEYMKLVGLENSTQEEFLEFLGARTADAKAVASAKDKLGLTEAQAQALVEKLTTALKGTLN